MDSGPRYSVVIPSYQSALTVSACLTSVLCQDFGETYEVLVVDSSTDETPAIVHAQFPEVKLIHLSRRAYPGEARNLGIARARGEVIAFLDSDCIAAPDWLSRIAARHAEGHRIVGGAVVNGTPGSPVGCAGYIAEFREFLPRGEPRLVPHIPTCNISYRAALFQCFGGFPESYYPQEDLVFNTALVRDGAHILFDPTVLVTHQQRTGFQTFRSHQRLIGQVTAQVLRDRGLPGGWLAGRPVLAVAALPALVGLKFMRTLGAFTSWQASCVLRCPSAWLLFGVGLFSWARGFASGLASPASTAMKS